MPKGTSRKGKKAWRRNIDAGDVEDAIASAAAVAAAGGHVGDRPDESLFFVDTAPQQNQGAPSAWTLPWCPSI